MRLFRDRGLLRRVIFALALVGYVFSFVLFLHGAAAMLGGQPEGLVTLLLGFYFLYQVTFLFVVASIIERRKTAQSIPFPDRRRKKVEAPQAPPPAREKAASS